MMASSFSTIDLAVLSNLDFLKEGATAINGYTNWWFRSVGDYDWNPVIRKEVFVANLPSKKLKITNWQTMN